MSKNLSNRNALFDHIYEQWQRERESLSLLPMKEGFYGDMRLFLETFANHIEAEIDSVVKKILQKRIERIQYVIDDLIELRTRKILDLIIQRQSIKVNVAREEYDYYERAKTIHDLYITKIFEPDQVAFINGLNLASSTAKNDDDEIISYVTLRIKQKVEQEIVGLDGQIYGPFEPEDILLIPKDNAIGLVKNKIAEKIEFKD